MVVPFQWLDRILKLERGFRHVEAFFASVGFSLVESFCDLGGIVRPTAGKGADYISYISSLGRVQSHLPNSMEILCFLPMFPSSFLFLHIHITDYPSSAS